jgi:hypothetical protein
LSTSDALVLLAGEHAYRLSTEVSRPVAVFPLSTRVAAEWTFRSAHVPDDRKVRLPLSAIQFSPRLAADGTAPADTRFEVPYTVRGAATSSGVRAPRFEVSYDESAIWRPVADSGAGRLGNTVELTVARAYLLR